jgi:hypothetical protein
MPEPIQSLGKHQQAAVRQLMNLPPAAQAELQAFLQGQQQAQAHRRGSGRGFAPSAADG